MRLVPAVVSLALLFAIPNALAQGSFKPSDAQKKQARDHAKSMAPKKHNPAACLSQCRVKPARYGCVGIPGAFVSVATEQCCKSKCGA